MTVLDRSERTVAVVPLRDPGVGKSRLASLLTTEQRCDLAIAMLTDVVAALRRSAVDDIVVAAGGAGAAAAAEDLYVSLIVDPPGGPSVDRALTGVVAQLPQDVGVLVVTADLPYLVASEVDQLLEIDREVVVARCADGGTGGLLQRPGARLSFAYGQGSAARHVAAARHLGRSTRVLASTGFERDIDTKDDLMRALDEVPIGTATAAVLAELLPDLRAGHRPMVVA